MIDLRSDTLTQPTLAMREAMAMAPVGDDVMREDPTVNQLEEHVAELLGKEAALFVASGTMGNQIGVRLHCQPGDEFFCEADCHIFYYEQAAYAQLFGLAAQPIEALSGLPTTEQLEKRLRKEDIHYPRMRLLCLENTHNRHGGRVLPTAEVTATCGWAKSHGLACHLDGARIWNAAIATGQSPAKLADPFDTVSVCFSKGLGAPVGSALAGPEKLIAQARRLRKAMGGGMRQAGILAAGAMFALEQHFQRLSEDHQNAQLLAAAIRDAPHLHLVADRCDTHLVLFEIDPTAGDAEAFCQRMQEQGVLMYAFSKQRVRAVTHLGVSAEDVQHAAELLVRPMANA